MRRVLATFGMAAMLVGVLVSPASALSSTVTVMGDTALGENQPGWMFNRDLSTSTPYEFNADAASIGVGSLYVQPIAAHAADKFVGENFLLTDIADVNSVSYDFKIGAGRPDTDKSQFYMNVYANFGSSSPTKFYDCRYNVVPTVGSSAGFTTVTFDPTQSYDVTTRSGSNQPLYPCPPVPADMDLASPGSTFRAIALNVGDSSLSDVGVHGYYDKVVVDTSGDVVIYDFEPALAPLNKNECKKDGWKSFNSPAFKNQGQCVSYLERNDNGLKGFLNNLFHLFGA